MPKRRRSPHDASLLFYCMDVLQIDHGKLAQDEPLLYRELQGVCTLCPNKRDCAFDLSDGFHGMRWDEWWLYCPNSAMLTTIGALQNAAARQTTPSLPASTAYVRIELASQATS